MVSTAHIFQKTSCTRTLTHQLLARKCHCHLTPCNCCFVEFVDTILSTQEHTLNCTATHMTHCAWPEIWDFPLSRIVQWNPRRWECWCEYLSPWIHTVKWCKVQRVGSFPVSSRSCNVTPAVSQHRVLQRRCSSESNVTHTCNKEYIIVDSRL